MINSPSFDIQQYLGTKTSYVFGTDMFIVNSGLEKTECIVIVDLGGGTQPGGYAREYYVLTVVAKYSTVQKSYTNISTIKKTLDNMPVTQINDFDYVGVWVTDGIEYVGKTEDNLFLHSISFNGIRDARLPEDKGNKDLLI